MNENKETTAVFSKQAAIVVATIAALGTVAGLGWKARDLVEEAHAAPRTYKALEEKVDRLEGKVDKVSENVASMKTDIALIKQQFELQGGAVAQRQPRTP